MSTKSGMTETSEAIVITEVASNNPEMLKEEVEEKRAEVAKIKTKRKKKYEYLIGDINDSKKKVTNSLRPVMKDVKGNNLEINFNMSINKLHVALRASNEQAEKIREALNEMYRDTTIPFRLTVKFTYRKITAKSKKEVGIFWNKLKNAWSHPKNNMC